MTFFLFGCDLNLSTRRYTYSLVFAADMYATVFKEDPLDPARGRLYRDKLLRVGGSREELDSLKVDFSLPISWPQSFITLEQDFLGREPNSEAFMKEIFGDSGRRSL